MSAAVAIRKDASEMLLEVIVALAHVAGKTIMEVYSRADPGQTSKQDDSPLTAAHTIVEGLASLTQSLLAKLGQHECISMGSSLKLCLVAEGKAHLYPRLGTTMEWDAAAAHAVVNEAGGTVAIPQEKNCTTTSRTCTIRNSSSML